MTLTSTLPSSALLPVIAACAIVAVSAAGALASPETNAVAADHAAGAHLDPVGQLPLWSALPFVGILLSIALFPLLAPHFWHHHFPR